MWILPDFLSVPGFRGSLDDFGPIKSETVTLPLSDFPEVRLRLTLLVVLL
jgi:hypothetical protein